MYRFIFVLAICLGMTACGGSGVKNDTSGTTVGQQQSQSQSQLQLQDTGDRVEVLYFHGKKRCATCMAIEKNTKEVVEEQFADELGNGTVVFRIIDISDPENEEIAEKYEVTWSSLFVSRWKDGKETYENLTEYAFANARTSPDTFKSGLTEKINELLK